MTRSIRFRAPAAPSLRREQQVTPHRLNRLFDPVSGRALDVAVDHGLFGEPGFLTGIERMSEVIDTLVSANPDAIQLSAGQAAKLQSRPGRLKPALVMRTDVANVYGDPLDEHLFSHHVPHAIEEAVRLDAVAVCANLMQLPGHPEIREANIRSIMELRREATRFGMPLMIEPLVMRTGGGGYSVDGDTDRIVALVRQAAELGADLIKADPTDDLSHYRRVIEVADGIPVLVRGGGRVDDRTLLERTARVLDAGASGIVYGRNVIQHENPAGIVAALMGVLHAGLSADAALALVGGGGR
jgi:DhnA family fructose-bisphosphate aldolase class Ia